MVYELHEIDERRQVLALPWALVCSRAKISYPAVWSGKKSGGENMSVRTLRALADAVRALSPVEDQLKW